MAVRAITTLHVPQGLLRMSQRDVVLMYHAVEAQPSGYAWSVSTPAFAAQLAWLRRYFAIVSLSEMVGSTSKQRRVALTFDDAYEDFYTQAYTELVRAKVPATVFVPTKFIESAHALTDAQPQIQPKRHLTWAQMRELQTSGLVQFECHSHAHVDVRGLDDAAFSADTATNRTLIETNLNHTPRFYAYPFGKRNATTDAALFEMGFERVFSTNSEQVGQQFVVGRYDIYRRNQSLDYFQLTLAGLLPDKLKAAVRGMKEQHR